MQRSAGLIDIDEDAIDADRDGFGQIFIELMPFIIGVAPVPGKFRRPCDDHIATRAIEQLVLHQNGFEEQQDAIFIPLINPALP